MAFSSWAETVFIHFKPYQRDLTAALISESCRIPFRTIVVSLLSHQVLLQNLYDILLEEFVKQPEGHERVTPVTSDPSRSTAGFLRYISMTNLAIILDLLLDSSRLLQQESRTCGELLSDWLIMTNQIQSPDLLLCRTARDFDTRPGLKYLLMKVSGVCGAANLYRQSAMSFNLYFQALLCATLSQADSMTAQQVENHHLDSAVIMSQRQQQLWPEALLYVFCLSIRSSCSCY